jgi:hypothetical protein
VWIGRRTRHLVAWPRRILIAISVGIALWGLSLAANIGGTAHSYQYVDNGSKYDPYNGINDIYVYDKDGNLVDGARLFDTNGNPIRLPQAFCQSSLPRMDANRNLVWAYPICPQDRGPFSGGPGPLNSPSPSATPTPSPSTPKPSTRKPAPAPTRTR